MTEPTSSEPSSQRKTADPSQTGLGARKPFLLARAGVGLKAQHAQEIIAQKPDIGWFEVHTENFMGRGGPPHRMLSEVAEHYPLSFHGVGLSLGSADGLNAEHLAHKAALVDRYRPFAVSEHLSWSIVSGVYSNDLLPMPYTKESLGVITDHVKQAQDVIGRRILIENPSTYLQFKDNEMPETEFFSALAEKAGCGVLLDVNNIFVSAWNHGFDAEDYLNALRDAPVAEMHLAGHVLRQISESVSLRLDDHGSKVSPPVWALFAKAVKLFGARPTLIEWDTDVPELSVLIEQAKMAETIMADPSVDAFLDLSEADHVPA